jgi:hypothetical protein
LPGLGIRVETSASPEQARPGPCGASTTAPSNRSEPSSCLKWPAQLDRHVGSDTSSPIDSNMSDRRRTTSSASSAWASRARELMGSKTAIPGSLAPTEYAGTADLDASSARCRDGLIEEAVPVVPVRVVLRGAGPAELVLGVRLPLPLWAHSRVVGQGPKLVSAACGRWHSRCVQMAWTRARRSSAITAHIEGGRISTSPERRQVSEVVAIAVRVSHLEAERPVQTVGHFARRPGSQINEAETQLSG